MLKMYQAWKNYYHYDEGKRLTQYMSGSNYLENEERRLLALRHLEAVLEFVKIK